MPGGCYVEGVSLDDAYFWKPSVGPIQDRPGHYNGPWHYWSTDGKTCIGTGTGTIVWLWLAVSLALFRSQHVLSLRSKQQNSC